MLGRFVILNAALSIRRIIGEFLLCSSQNKISF